MNKSSLAESLQHPCRLLGDASRKRVSWSYKGARANAILDNILERAYKRNSKQIDGEASVDTLPNFPFLFQQIKDYLEHYTEYSEERRNAYAAFMQIHDTIYGHKPEPGR